MHMKVGVINKGTSPVGGGVHELNEPRDGLTETISDWSDYVAANHVTEEHSVHGQSSPPIRGSTANPPLDHSRHIRLPPSHSFWWKLVQ